MKLVFKIYHVAHSQRRVFRSGGVTFNSVESLNRISARSEDLDPKWQ